MEYAYYSREIIFLMNERVVLVKNFLSRRGSLEQLGMFDKS